MAKVESKQLVIDASVARAAGPLGATHPTAANCRNFLQAVLDICHQVVMNPEIREEWNKHQSRFARTWLGQMVARKKLVTLKAIPIDPDLWEFLENLVENDNQRAKIVKDIHLLEAALASDQRIVSLDDNTARKWFNQAAIDHPPLQEIVWVNPDVEAEQPIDWLKRGAPEEPQRMLGQKP